MAGWKNLRLETGTGGWKELERESGTGAWKALEWDYEDFTTFTEVDIGADRIQKTARHVDHLAYRNETTYLYKDYGAAYFGNFTHKIKVKAVNSSSNALSIPWVLANDLGDVKALADASKTYLGFYLYHDGDLAIVLEEGYNGEAYYDVNAGGFDYDEWAYIKIVKNGASIDAYLYSDAEYTTLVDTLSLTLQANHTFRYLYAGNTYNSGDNLYLAQEIENFDIGE